MRGQVLEIDCDQPERALLALRALERFDEVALYGAQIHAVVAGADGLKPLVAQTLSEQGVALHSQAVIPPSLEDVFIARIR
ncbi:MAG TPA: ABC transporter ATP-binding protein, partial [Anaerolineae bacterium]|nr:ABC transporter ATP-binding protein [Anaerolineae bacterium]